MPTSRLRTSQSKELLTFSILHTCSVIFLLCVPSISKIDIYGGIRIFLGVLLFAGACTEFEVLPEDIFFYLTYFICSFVPMRRFCHMMYAAHSSILCTCRQVIFVPHFYYIRWSDVLCVTLGSHFLCKKNSNPDKYSFFLRPPYTSCFVMDVIHKILLL